ncbi:MAG: BlaI/MecI/CopY family transcriptional regulator [Planctomycetaceae bacterium]
MSRNPAPKPTDAELGLLRVLWDRGPSTVREIHEALRRQKTTGYTTTLKILQRMTEKGLVRRDESKRSHVYEAVLQAEETQRRLVGDLVRLAFGGSREQLVVQALSDQKATPEELAEIRRVLDELEARQSAKGKP